MACGADVSLQATEPGRHRHGPPAGLRGLSAPPRPSGPAGSAEGQSPPLAEQAEDRPSQAPLAETYSSPGTSARQWAGVCGRRAGTGRSTPGALCTGPLAHGRGLAVTVLHLPRAGCQHLVYRWPLGAGLQLAGPPSREGPRAQSHPGETNCPRVSRGGPRTGRMDGLAQETQSPWGCHTGPHPAQPQGVVTLRPGGVAAQPWPWMWGRECAHGTVHTQGRAMPNVLALKHKSRRSGVAILSRLTPRHPHPETDGRECWVSWSTVRLRPWGTGVTKVLGPVIADLTATSPWSPRAESTARVFQEKYQRKWAQQGLKSTRKSLARFFLISKS